MIKELKLPRQRRQQEPRNVIGFLKRDRQEKQYVYDCLGAKQQFCSAYLISRTQLLFCS